MDWNIQVDVKSAKYVLDHSNPTLIPLTVTVETALRRAYLDNLQNSGALGRLIAKQAKAFAVDEAMESKYGETCKGLPKDIINFLHDPLACAIALGWKESVEIKEVPIKLEIRDSWLVEEIDAKGKPTKVVIGIDGNKFSDLWISIVSAYGKSA